jgi:hypothetical protein
MRQMSRQCTSAASSPLSRPKISQLGRKWKRVNEKGEKEYLVKWQGFTTSHNEWLKEKDLARAPVVLERFLREQEHLKGAKGKEKKSPKKSSAA